jgi:hypothetical protein
MRPAASFPLHRVAPLSVGPSTSFASTFLSDNEQDGPHECVFLPKDVPTQFYVKKENDQRNMWSSKSQSGKHNIKKTSYIPVLNNDHETVAYIRRHKQGKGLALLDGVHHEPYVLCLPFEQSFVIYCRRPRTAADNEMWSVVQYDGDPFYPWVKISYLRDDAPVFHVWDGQSFQGPSNDPFFVVNRKVFHQDCNQNEASLLEILSGTKTLLCSSSHIRDSNECNFQLAADADPAMMLTLLVVLAPEMLGI